MRTKDRNEKTRKHAARRSRVVRRIASSDRPRLTVFRSSRHIYAQLDDPISGRTLGSVSTRSQQVAAEAPEGGKLEAAKRVGRAIADLARRKNIDAVVFNRNGFLYHGRIKALADAARDAGLKF
jgi:large subunit ribosomal protein L18